MSSAFFRKFFHRYNKDDVTVGMAKRMLQTTQDIKKLSFLLFFRNRLLLKIPFSDCLLESYSIHASFRYWNVCLILVSTWQLLFPDAFRSFPMCLKHLNFRMQRRWETQTWMCGLAKAVHRSLAKGNKAWLFFPGKDWVLALWSNFCYAECFWNGEICFWVWVEYVCGNNA